MPRMAETTIHQQLKALYADDEAGQEVQLNGYRIDAIVGERLIEIQCAGLSAIRDKIQDLVTTHQVVVVKPLCEKKTLLKKSRKGGKVLSRRKSPLCENYYDIFDELVHFKNAFPHPNLTLEILLTEQEEVRLPAVRKGRRRRLRQRVEDRRLVAVTGKLILRNNSDLQKMLPDDLPKPFTTADIAQGTDIDRGLAQKMAYCLKHSGAIKQVGKQGNAILYAQVETAAKKKTVETKANLRKSKLRTSKSPKPAATKAAAKTTTRKKTTTKASAAKKASKKATGKQTATTKMANKAA